MKHVHAFTSRIFLITMIGSAFVFAQGWSNLFFLSLAIHLLVTTVFSTVIHRYYSHSAFEANEKVMYWLSYLPVMYFYASPISFMPHSAHHALSDTPDDTHIRGWRGFFLDCYKPAPMKFKRQAVRLSKMPKHLWLHNNGMYVAIGWALLMLAISPTLFLFVNVIPTFTVHLANRIHVNLSHYGGAPQNRWYLEYIIPFGGEWQHAYHHAKPKDSKFSQRWFELDTGSWLSNLLKSNG